MVVTAQEPATVVPDPAAWALQGVDVFARGFRPAASPALASVLVAPASLPPGLAPAVGGAWAEMPPPRRLVELDAPGLDGVPVGEAVLGGHGGHGGHGEHGEHGEHGDMMEITGEPSGDGLVMESIEFEHGPLALGVPGGLVLRVELDGDVVCSCEVRAMLRSDGPVPDPLSAAAWAAADRRARVPVALGAVAALERERALSHLVWLWSFGVVLGWEELWARAWMAAAPLIGSERHGIVRAGAEAERLHAMLRRSRRLRARTRGRAVVTRAEAERRGIAGPNARASGIARDVRADDPRYRGLGFSTRTHDAGDVEARVLQRAAEACDSLRLAAEALDRAEEAVDHVPDQVEGPRGPVRVADAGPQAAGAAAERALAGELTAGLEWASAITAVASFDLSPWEVPG